MRILLINIVLCLGFLTVYAEDPKEQPIPAHYSGGVISVLPTYMLVNGLRVDYDFALTPNHRIQLGPVLFFMDRQFDFNDNIMGINRQTGAGLHLYQRYYPGDGFGNTPVYIAYGGLWHYNHLTWNETIGINEFERYTTINRVGGDVIIGLHVMAANVLMLDFYTGLGLRHSTYKSDAQYPDFFRGTWFSPGFSGTLMILGVRIGVYTGKKN